MKKTFVFLVAVVLVCPAWSQLFGDKKTPDERRGEIRADHSAILKEIFGRKPELEKKIENAPGYATFNTLNVNLLLLSTVRGTGVAIDNKSGEEIFMKVTSVGGGVGAGIKDLRALLVFNDHVTLRRFVDSGWQFGAQANASLKADDKGAAVGESASVAPSKDGDADTALSSGAGEVTGAETSIEIYRITKTGISLQATIAGTKFSKLGELNESGSGPDVEEEKESKGIWGKFKKND